jgi:hypothetical protein
MIYKRQWKIPSLVILFIFVLLLVSCAHRPFSYKEGAVVAVWDLDDVSPSGITQPDLGELFSGKIIETLKAKGRFSVVERERLLLALEELHLGTESFVDEDTRLKLGRLIGARLMVFGGYQIIADTMRVDLRLIEVESGRVLKAVKETISDADLSGWLNAVSDAAVKL